MKIARTDTKPDWAAIRAEYIGGGISQRAISKKYGVSENTLMKKANAERWNDQREEAYSKAAAKAQQKAADAAAGNAAAAQRIRSKLLAVLEREIDALPDSIGSEMHQDVTNLTYDGKNGNRMTKRADAGKRFKLTDLTRAYKDLTEGMEMIVDMNDNAIRNMQTIAGLINNPEPDVEIEDVTKPGETP